MAFNEYNYIGVNYHYIEDPNPKFPGIFPCSIEEFKRQVKFFSENYAIVSVPELFDAAKNQKSGKFCAITFDDGLKGQYVNALPILKNYSAIATFFPVTAPLEGRLPSAHKNHVLLSHFAINDLIALFDDFMNQFYPDLKSKYPIPKDRRLTQRRLHEDIPVANFKEALIVLPEDVKNQFLRFAFKQTGLKEKYFAEQLFMSEKDIKDLQRQGMIIGGHTHSHYAMNVIGEETLKKDIELSKEILSSLVNISDVFSYPHGRYNEAAQKVIKESGFNYAVTIEKRGLEPDESPLLIPRFDTNDIKLELA